MNPIQFHSLFSKLLYYIIIGNHLSIIDLRLLNGIGKLKEKLMKLALIKIFYRVVKYFRMKTSKTL